MNRWLPLICCFLSLTASNGFAQWQDWFRNQDQQAKELMAHGQPAQAARTFKDNSWRAAAHYRAGHYELAADTLKHAHSIRDHYNLGNSYAHMGAYDKAISAYQQVLKQDPSHADAQFNLKLVQTLKQKQQQQNDRKPQQSKDQSFNKQNKQKPQNQSKSQSQDQPRDPSQEQHPQQKAENKRKSSSPKHKRSAAKQPKLSRNELEKQQANQQWLKRIQEEPQDLLKQKFLRDYLKRRKQGGFNESKVNGGADAWS